MALIDKYKELIRITPEFVHMMPLQAVPKERPRFSKTGRAYTSKRTRDFEKAVAKELTRAMGGREPFKGFLKLSIITADAIPDSFSMSRRLMAMMTFILPTRGDCDNRFKAVADAANGILYFDDSQVGEIYGKKVYSKAGPYITVQVEQIGLTGFQEQKFEYDYRNKNG